MTILAIDPGTEKSAFVIWDGKTIQEYNYVDNAFMLEVIGNARDDEGADHLAVEMIASYGMAVGKEVFGTCVWVGRFQQWWEGLSPYWTSLIPRLEVKLHLCHNPKAKTTNINQALKDRFGGKGTKKNPGVTYGLNDHTWAAFAVAVTAYDKLTGANHE